MDSELNLDGLRPTPIELDPMIPPWDSPLEEVLANQLWKYIQPGALYTKQHPAETVGGIFRLDFRVEVEGHAVGFECDGREFHDPRDDRDWLRDALIIDSGIVSSVIRFRAVDLHYHPEVCLYIASKVEPQVFSDRGKTNLVQLARVFEDPYDWDDRILDAGKRETEDSEEDRPYVVTVYRHTAEPKGVIVPREQKDFVEFAKSYGRSSLDTLIAEWRKA